VTKTKTHNEAFNTRRQVSDGRMIETPEHTDQRAQYEIKNDVMACLLVPHPVDSHLQSNQSAAAPTLF
jgi:hypothetical protein